MTGWTLDQMAARAAADIPEGAFVNLGIGLPERVAEPEGDAVVVRSEGLTGIAVAVCAVATIALGVFPGPVLSQLSKIVILLP